MRPTISFERHIDTLTTSIEAGRKQAEERYDELNSKLDQVLATIHRLEALYSNPASDVRPAPAPDSASIAQPEAANPEPTDELREIVTRVVNNARHRVGTKKSGPFDNAFKVCVFFRTSALVILT